MKHKYIWLLILISFLLTNVVAFLDESIRAFDYLTRLGDWIALIIYTVLFLILPILIFFLIKKENNKRFRFALFGFLPVVFLIFLQLASTI